MKAGRVELKKTSILIIINCPLMAERGCKSSQFSMSSVGEEFKFWNGGMVSRTFTHRTLAYDWYFIGACKLKSIGLFKTFFFLPRVPG